MCAEKDKLMVLEEYKDASSNMRHYGNMRFAQLTLIVALTGGLMALVFKDSPCAHELIRTSLKILGIILAALFWLMEGRATKYHFSYRKRAEELEAALEFQQFKNAPKREFFTATTATHIFYIAVVIFWLITIFGH